MILGASDLIAQIFELTPNNGILLSEDDVKQKAAVAVLGNKVTEKLFGNTDPINKKIKIKNKTFRVIGTFPKKGNVSFFNVDEMILIPSSTAQEYLLGINHYHAILVQAESEAAVPQTVEDIKNILRDLHNITDPEKDDFHVTTQADAAERVGSIMGILTAFLVAIAAVSLLVGGIGIMNIMLVSVTERTREIGLRKALGATNKNILLQFLSEAILLTIAGGFIGVVSGAGTAFLVSIILTKVVGMEWTFTFPFGSAFLGLAVSAIVGLIFGLYPARQAAKKSPMEALRYE
jgi:putative ABC transport system permease protein